MIERLVQFSLSHRGFVVGLTLAAALGALIYGQGLELDALPDVTGNQVIVLTGAPGYTPQEVERLVTLPIETGLGGLPGLQEQRSLSRYGISSVTMVFDEDVDPYLARQLVQERLNSVAAGLPEDIDPPELGPLTGGLGEIFHFTLSSPARTPAELYELAVFEVSPVLRTVPGVVEVNTWGGKVRTLDVVVDSNRLAHYKLTLADVKEAVEGSVGSAAGASIRNGTRQTLLRGISRPNTPQALGQVVVMTDRVSGAGAPIRLADIAEIEAGALPRLGGATANGRGETVYVMVQMLRNANALEVMNRIHERMPDVHALLPKDVEVRVAYDRSDLVLATLGTVFKNLGEGGLLVVLILLGMLGSLRAGLVVALTIPLSMLGAVAGMVLFGIPGNLMSLGAIDFGLLVDGAVVMVEGFFAALKGASALDGRDRISQAAISMARPVFYSVLIILLVYVPILTLVGVDGKMFRPMAITVILALLTSLLLSMTFVPAISSLLLKPKHVPSREPHLVRLAHRIHAPLLEIAMKYPRGVLISAAVLLVGGLAVYAQLGTTFVPQLDEGDMVVQTTRASDISLGQGTLDAGKMEAALIAEVPEVIQVVSRIGSPAVATDIMGLEQADVFVSLKPKDQWRPGLTREALIAHMDAVLTKHDPGGDPVFTQPIQMRFNELLGGETTDVALSIFGADLDELRRQAEATVAVIETQPGAVDVRVSAPPSVPLMEVQPNPLAAAQLGFTVAEVLDAVRAVRTGIEVGTTYEGRMEIPIRLRLAQDASVSGIKTLNLANSAGRLIPLARLAKMHSSPTPSLVDHDNGLRRMIVGFNVRGGDLGQVVEAAKAKVDAQVKLPPLYRMEWGGQYETLAAATQRMQVVIPIVLLLIFGVLMWTFSRVRPALIIFLNVPFAGVGGVLALAARGMPVSISAAVGFIALSGIAVLNGVVLMTRLLAYQEEGRSARDAAYQAALDRMRPVVMTALVAALGFVPMMLATGVGAEVQRPLATVVVGGLLTSTLLTLVIVPALFAWLGSGVDSD